MATTDEHKAVQESMRGWAAAIRPIATMRSGEPGYWREFWPSLVGLGVFRVALPEAAGGADGSVNDLAVLIEQAAHDLVGGPISATALTGLVTGGALDEDTPAGIALGDPVAVRGNGTGDLVLTGVWETVLGAAEGTAVLLPVSFSSRRAWCLIGPGVEGLRIEELSPLDPSTPLARVVCDGVRVAADRIFEPPYAVGDLIAALVAAELAGIAGWCLETATDYAKVREQFGRKIGEFQAVKHICAGMLCRAELIRAVAADAAAAVDNRSDELPLAAAIAMSVALDAAVETAKDCIQVLGGIGFTWEHDAHLYLRRAVALRQLLGGGSVWRARVTELVRAGKRRTVGLDLGADLGSSRHTAAASSSGHTAAASSSGRADVASSSGRADVASSSGRADVTSSSRRAFGRDSGQKHAGMTGAGDAGMTGAGDAGMTGAGDAGMTGAGDAGMTGAGDAGMTGAGDAGMTEGEVAAWEAVGLSAGDAVELGADIARIAALPVERQRDALVDTGLLAPHWPSPYGRGAGPILRTLIDEQVRGAGITVPDIQIGNWAVPTLLQYGTPEQIERFVQPTLRGEVIWCQLFSEPEAGSDLAALRTTATRVDGGWKLRGQKVWTSLANVANWGICLARTDAEVPKHRGISYFLVDMNSPGIDIRPLVQITGEARFSEVFLDEVFVPDDCLVGELGGGWKIARSTLSSERVAMGGSGIGEELETLIATAPTDGPGAELIADRIGDLVAQSVAGLLLETRAAQRMLAGIDPGPQSSVRKLVGVRHRQAVAEFAVELAGVAGAQESDVVKEFLLTRCLSIAGGTEQILLTVAGERILGLPRESHG
ncbi:acyl-CoA dehydrogenase [Nocardia thraciensis]